MSVPLPPSGTCVRCVSRFRWDEFFFCCHRLTTISVCVALAWRVKVRFFLPLCLFGDGVVCGSLSLLRRVRRWFGVCPGVSDANVCTTRSLLLIIIGCCYGGK